MHLSGEIALPLWRQLDQMGQRTTADALYQDHRQRVFRLCLRLGGGNVSWAEDATQDVFVKLLERLDRLAETDDLGGWIYRVTMNTCMTRLKREGSVWGRVVQVLWGATTVSSRDTPERQVQVQQGLDAALRLVQTLPAKERVVFCMRHLDDMPQRQIARTLELSEGYVSKLLDRTRARLVRQGWEVPDA